MQPQRSIAAQLQPPHFVANVQLPAKHQAGSRRVFFICTINISTCVASQSCLYVEALLLGRSAAATIRLEVAFFGARRVEVFVG